MSPPYISLALATSHLDYCTSLPDGIPRPSPRQPPGVPHSIHPSSQRVFPKHTSPWSPDPCIPQGKVQSLWLCSQVLMSASCSPPGLLSSHLEHSPSACTSLNALCYFRTMYTASLSSLEDTSALITPASSSKFNPNITSSRKPSHILQSDLDALSFELPSSSTLPSIAAELLIFLFCLLYEVS